MPDSVSRLREQIEKHYRERKDIPEDVSVSREEVRTWIADMARRAPQIQGATHILKFTAPDAPRAGANILKRLPQRDDTDFVGTHSVGAKVAVDVTGNAAALDVYKFLKLEHAGRSFMEFAVAEDPEFLKALSPSLDEARTWAKAFAGIFKPLESFRPASHTSGKQVYWPMGGDEYHILAPLFSSGLVHEVHTRVQKAKFGDEAKARREDRRQGRRYEGEIHDYARLLTQKFGGTKAQNISQLNSERRGGAYLLSSLPPVWRSPSVRAPLKIESVFGPEVLGYRNRRILEDLKNHLAKGRATKEVRERRDDLIDEIFMDIMNYAISLREELVPGWSKRVECKLKMEERLWLDPLRSDSDFSERRRNADWQEGVARRFAKWLNRNIQVEDDPMGDPEFEEWRRRMMDVLRAYDREYGNE